MEQTELSSNLVRRKRQLVKFIAPDQIGRARLQQKHDGFKDLYQIKLKML